MKRFACLLLILWLPLFTGTALAMSTQMQVANELQQLQQSPHSPFHDTRHADSHKSGSDHCHGHCLGCGICAFGYQTANFTAATTVFIPAASALPAPNALAVVFSSQLYPPAIKPPIRA